MRGYLVVKFNVGIDNTIFFMSFKAQGHRGAGVALFVLGCSLCCWLFLSNEQLGSRAIIMQDRLLYSLVVLPAIAHHVVGEGGQPHPSAAATSRRAPRRRARGRTDPTDNLQPIRRVDNANFV